MLILRAAIGPQSLIDALVVALPEHEVRVCAEGALLDSIEDAEVLIPARARVTSSVLDRASSCRLIQQMGSGTDMIDITEATKRGIAVANVPSTVSGAAESVAELALFLTLGVMRSYPVLTSAVASARWSEVPLARTISGSTIGILGVGGIGSALARMLRSFDCRVVGIKRKPDMQLVEGLGLAWVGGVEDLGRMLAEVDVLVLTLPLNSVTDGIIGDRELSLMRPGSYIVNVARPALINRQAVMRALGSGSLRGLALDVFWDEPADQTDPIFEHNVFVTPHVGGYTELMVTRASKVVADNIHRLATNQPLQYTVGL